MVVFPVEKIYFCFHAKVKWVANFEFLTWEMKTWAVTQISEGMMGVWIHNLVASVLYPRVLLKKNGNSYILKTGGCTV